MSKTPRAQFFRIRLDRFIYRELTASLDDPIMNDGAPCAVQIVARRFKDEECLHAARVVDKVLKT